MSAADRKAARERLIASSVETGLLSRAEAEKFADALRDISGSITAAGDQAQAMTDAELGELLLTGRWSTIEIHEAGRRLKARQAAPEGEDPTPDREKD